MKKLVSLLTVSALLVSIFAKPAQANLNFVIKVVEGLIFVKEAGEVIEWLQDDENVDESEYKRLQRFDGAPQAFPDNDCHSLLPTSDNDYPIKWYPIFIEYSPENLINVRNEFCQNAYQVGRDSILVSAYDESELYLAENLMNALSKDYAGIRLGEASVITEDPRQR